MNIYLLPLLFYACADGGAYGAHVYEVDPERDMAFFKGVSRARQQVAGNRFGTGIQRRIDVGKASGAACRS